jgi:hypothetical protein
VVAAFAAVPLLGQETGIEQDAEVLGDRRAAHFEVCRNVADRAFGFGEQIQHLASRTMADRGEHIGLAIGSQNHDANMRKQSLTCQAQEFSRRQASSRRLFSRSISRFTVLRLRWRRMANDATKADLFE